MNVAILLLQRKKERFLAYAKALNDLFISCSYFRQSQTLSEKISLPPPAMSCYFVLFNLINSLCQNVLDCPFTSLKPSLFTVNQGGCVFLFEFEAHLTFFKFNSPHCVVMTIDRVLLNNSLTKLDDICREMPRLNWL